MQALLAIAWSRLRGDVEAQPPQRARPAATAAGRVATPSTISLSLRIDQVVHHKLRPSPCVTMDWWPAEKCDYGDCAWENASLLTANLADPLLVGAIKALSPVALRIGGSLGDQVFYAARQSLSAQRGLPDGSCKGRGFELDLSRRVGFRGGCLPFARWLQLLELCTFAGCHVIFSVNALRGRQRETCPQGTLCRPPAPRSGTGGGSTISATPAGHGTSAPVRPSCCTNYSGAWDAGNLRTFLRATAASGHRPAGLAFGNELVTDKGIEAHLPARQYADEVLRFGAVVRSVWPAHPPMLIAPDTNHIDEAWLTDFLDALWPLTPTTVEGGMRNDEAAGDGVAAGDAGGESPAVLPLDVISHHMYPLGAGDEFGLRAKLLDPKRLDQTIADRLRLAARVVTNRTRGQARLCVSETGGAYNSGQRGVTDAFGSTFWWLDLLGEIGKHGHDFACRQALVGGHYALLDLARRQPNPDFWATLLWRRIVSPKVLRAVKFAGVRPSSRANATATSSSAAGASAASAPAPAADTEAGLRPRPSLAMLRAYAACARSNELGLNVLGGVVVLLINLSSESTHVVTVELEHNSTRSKSEPGGGGGGGPVHSADPNGTMTPRYDFVLTASSLSSRTVHLNGEALRAHPDGTIPTPEGVAHAGRVLTIAPLSASFHVFPEARNAGCFTPQQQTEQARELKREQRIKAQTRRRVRVGHSDSARRAEV